MKARHTQSPKFVILGDTRIKLSNIKNYGISVRERKEYKETSIAVDLVRFGLNTFLEFLSSSGGGNSEPATITIKYSVLYVTTYQGENYTFSEESSTVNIHEKLKELDKCFT